MERTIGSKGVDYRHQMLQTPEELSRMSAEPIKVEGDFPVHFRYTVGIAAERFFRELKDNGKLVASRCENCNLNYIPPRMYCERCMARLEKFVSIENSGIVDSVTMCELDADGKRLGEPMGVAFVRFQGAHGGLVHRTRGAVDIGDKVRAVFKDMEERTGSIQDIRYFERTT